MDSQEFIEKISIALLRHPAGSFEEMIERLDQIYSKDRGKTNEINLLTEECRDQEAEIKHLRAMIDVVRLDVFEEREALQAQVATLTGQRDTAQAATAAMAQKCERLMACAEHYDHESNWDITWGVSIDTPFAKYYLPDTDGWAVARDALKEGEEDGR